jgi:hypothetical protein
LKDSSFAYGKHLFFAQGRRYRAFGKQEEYPLNQQFLAGLI